MVSRFECLQYLAEVVKDSLVILWGGGEKDEWWNLQQYPPSLWTAMGIATPMGLGLALALPHRRVVVIDTDGGILLNLGTLATLGNLRPPNLTVLIIDNECYEATGAQPTATAGRTDLAAIARGAGIEQVETTRTLEEFKEAINRALSDKALHFIVAKVEKGIKKVPPDFTEGIESKYKFVRYIEETENIKIIIPPLQKRPDDLLR